MTENEENIKNLFLTNNNNKTLVASRKIRALNEYNLNQKENNLSPVKKRKINKLFMNTSQEVFNKVLEDKNEKNISDNNKGIIKKTLTNNNSYTNININININLYLNLNNS